MLRFAAVRLLSLIPVLLGVSICSFALIHLVPGDVATVIAGSMNGGPGAVEEVRRSLHLNEPLPLQYVQWLGGALHGDLGTSLILGFPVFPEIMSRLPVTLELAACATVLSIVPGVGAGILAARFHGRLPDHLLRGLSLLGLSTPDFFLGTVIILVGSLLLPGLHTVGFVPLSQNVGLNLESVFWPAATLALPLAAILMRYTRAAVLDTLSEPWVVTARAKGLSSRTILFRHVLRNALIPVVTIAGVNGVYLLGGTVVIEQVFALPGVGQLTLNAISHRDYPTVQGAVLVITTGVVLLNLVVDLLYAAIDPRIGADG